MCDFTDAGLPKHTNFDDVKRRDKESSRTNESSYRKSIVFNLKVFDVAYLLILLLLCLVSNLERNQPPLVASQAARQRLSRYSWATKSSSALKPSQKYDKNELAWPRSYDNAWHRRSTLFAIILSNPLPTNSLLQTGGTQAI